MMHKIIDDCLNVSSVLEVRHPRASDLPRDPEAVGRGGPLQVPPDAGRQLLHAARRLEVGN